MKCERVTTMKNQEIAQLLYEIADFLEIEDVEYKPRAYRTAARNVESLSEPVEDVYERGELEAIDGVGESIAEKIADYLETGQPAYYEELKADLPIDIEAITSVSGVGPKTAKKLYFELGVTTLEDLERAADAGEIAPLEGFGEKSQQSILDHVERAKRGQERMLLGRADPIARELETRLQSADEFERVDIVGSFRRRRPTVGDLDVLATAPNPEAATDVFCTHDDVTEVLARGETKSSVVVSGDLQVDLRIVDEREYGAALVYFYRVERSQYRAPQPRRSTATGSSMSTDSSTSATETTRGGRRIGERIASETEEAIYNALELDWIPPELRENTGSSMPRRPESYRI